MWGYGHCRLGRGYWRQRGWWPSVEGYTYLGPCRCGFGPHAFWQEKTSGRIFRGLPPWQADLGSKTETYEELRAELNRLKREKEELEKIIRDLEAEFVRKKEKD